MSVRFRLIFSLACAALMALLCVRYADHVRAEAERTRSEALERFGGEVTRLVVATETLAVGDVVSRSNVILRDWVSDLAPEGALTDLDAVIGREIGVATAKGTPLTELSLSMAGDVADVPPGHVALTIPVTDRLGVSRSVAQGTSLVAYAVGSEGTRLVSGEMLVLSDPAVATAIGSTPQLTVAVLPDDVASVLGASATGDLRLVIPAHDVDAASDMGVQAPVELADADGAGMEGGGDQ